MLEQSLVETRLIYDQWPQCEVMCVNWSTVAPTDISGGCINPYRISLEQSNCCINNFLRVLDVRCKVQTHSIKGACSRLWPGLVTPWNWYNRMRLWYTSTSHLHTYHLIISVSCALQPQPLRNKWRKQAIQCLANGFQFGNDDWHRESNEIPTINPATPWHQHHITSNTKRRRFRSSAWPVNMSKLSMQLALMSLDPSSEMITPRQFAGFVDSTI